MTKQEDLAQYLDRNIRFPRVPDLYGWPTQLQYPPVTWYHYQRPTSEELAEQLLDDTEFRALQLGTWLGTTQGQVIAEAVEMVTPPFYRGDVELLVDGLTLAARMQATEGERAAGKVVLGVIGLVAVLIVLRGWGGGSTA